jgi:hypothetical protein
VKHRAWRYFTIVLFLVCVWTIFANVLGDDTEVRARAEQTARAKAGCGDKCKVTGIHGSRGMIDFTATYDIDAFGQIVATCRRSFVVAGDYACTADKP